jgi:hypothetical protein
MYRCTGAWSVASATVRGRRGLGAEWASRVAAVGPDALAVRSFEAGRPELDAQSIEARFEASPGSRAIVALCAAHQEPLVFPARAELEQRLESTGRVWRDWVASNPYEGPYRDAVIRSALALKLLVARAIRRGRRRRDDLAAGGDRRRTQLGPSLLLGSRLGLHPRCVPQARLRVRGTRLLLVADARLAADPSPTAGSLPAGRRRSGT